MRIHRLLAFLSVAALAPLARGGAQTCQGTAQFREGKARIGVDYQRSGDLDYYRAGIAYGVQGSFFGGVSVDETQLSHGGASTTGFGGSLGYQFHWVDTPFQICPLVTLNYASGNGANTIVYEGYIQNADTTYTLYDLDCSFTGSEAGIAAVSIGAPASAAAAALKAAARTVMTRLASVHFTVSMALPA